jgi:acyl carrier protein
MSREEVFSKLNEVFVSVFDDDNLRLTESMTAADYEPWDSLSHIRLIVSVEEAFRIRFASSEVAALRNVGDLVDSIERKLQNK